MQDFTTALYRWYRVNKRALPWRLTSDPYKIWISEIILQQTRVAQGIDYYQRFIKKYTTVDELAAASEDEVLKLWQGLGYYSRARNLHQAAQSIVRDYQGIFPDSYNKIRELKGIGPYTAAAIASIAFSLPYPVIDGNVYRVLSRYQGIETPIDSNRGKKEFINLAEELLDRNNPGLHNEALMEFGALQCVPQIPDCPGCPVAETCSAFLTKKVALLPVKQKKTKQTARYFYYYLLENDDFIYLDKRTGNDIWKNLYQLPLIEEESELSDTEVVGRTIPFMNGPSNFRSITGTRKHILSHRIIRARVIRLEISDNTEISPALIRVNKKDISKFAVPRLLELFFDDLNLNK